MNTENKFMVSVQGKYIKVLLPPNPNGRLSQEEAFLLAAWLVVLAEYSGPLKFADVLDAVETT